MIAQVCKRCPEFKSGSSFCELHMKTVSQWNDWCEERKWAWEEWRLRQ